MNYFVTLGFLLLIYSLYRHLTVFRNDSKVSEPVLKMTSNSESNWRKWESWLRQDCLLLWKHEYFV